MDDGGNLAIVNKEQFGLDDLYCEAPRHSEMEIPSEYLMVFVYDNRDLLPEIQRMCKECMQLIADDLDVSIDDLKINDNEL